MGVMDKSGCLFACWQRYPMILEQRSDTGVASGRLDIQRVILSENLPKIALSIRYAPFPSGPTRKAADRQGRRSIMRESFPQCEIHTTSPPPQYNNAGVEISKNRTQGRQHSNNQGDLAQPGERRVRNAKVGSSTSEHSSRRTPARLSALAVPRRMRRGMRDRGGNTSPHNLLVSST